MFSNFNCGTVKMSLKNNIALVSQTKAGRNINVRIFLLLVFYTSVEIGSAIDNSYCVKYLLTGLF